MTRTSPRRRRTVAAAALTALALAAVACGSDDSSSDTTAAPATSEAGGGIDAARCDTNKAAGKITYSSSFDFAAAASIVDVVVAKDKGYFDDLCLDVDLVPGFSTSNYPLVTAGTAQFSSAGNFTEILNFSQTGGEYVAFVNYGKEPIEALVTPESGATQLEQLDGKTIGVKGDLPPSIVALLAEHGLSRGTDYKEILLDGFDPVSQLASGIDALPVYKSNEPGQLDRAGVSYHLFDPAADDIPGTFGILYTSKDFYAEHPTVVEDFARAALKGMEDAIADPAGAVKLSVARIDAAGNQNYLTEEGETFRWKQELQAVLDSTPEGQPVGLIDPDGVPRRVRRVRRRRRLAGRGAGVHGVVRHRPGGSRLRVGRQGHLAVTAGRRSMRAQVQHGFGGLEVCSIERIPAPSPAPEEVVLAVEACALNRLDLLQREAPLVRGFALPHIAGMDVVGIVIARSPDLADDVGPRVGDRVLVDPVSTCGVCARCTSGLAPYCERLRTIGSTRPGGFAEQVAVPAPSCFPIPAGMSAVEAATLPVAAMTAWHALVAVGKVAAGETVLINGAGSGVSIAAMQLAKAAGRR